MTGKGSRPVKCATGDTLVKVVDDGEEVEDGFRLLRGEEWAAAVCGGACFSGDGCCIDDDACGGGGGW